MTNLKNQMTNKFQMSNFKTKTEEKKFDIYDRALTFAVRVVKSLEHLPKSMAVTEYGRQLVRSSGSIGANIEEADGTLTKADFVNKMGIARREARESRHWLKLLKAVLTPEVRSQTVEIEWLIQESTEILLILSSIINNTKNRS